MLRLVDVREELQNKNCDENLLIEEHSDFLGFNNLLEHL